MLEGVADVGRFNKLFPRVLVLLDTPEKLVEPRSTLCGDC
jgi:hypothetical protein